MLARAAVFALAVAGCTHLCPDLAIEPDITLHIVDAATGQPVADPTFAEGPRSIYATCSAPTDGGAGCTAWWFFVVGAHTVTVSAAGYASKDVSFDTGENTTDCGTFPQHTVELTVPLTH